MNLKKLLALVLVLILVSSTMAFAQELEDAAVPAEAPAATEPTPAAEESQQPEQEETPAAEPELTALAEIEETESPATEASTAEAPATEVPMTEAPATDVPATEVPETEAPATDVPATEVPETQAPATDIPETLAPTPESTEVSGAIVPGTAAPEITVEPTEEIYISEYAFVPNGTVLYRDRERTEKLGELTADAVMLTYENTVYEEGILYEVYFDTEETYQTPICERAYFFRAEALERPDQLQTEALLLSELSYHDVNAAKVFLAALRYEPLPAPETSHINIDGAILYALPDAASEPIAVLSLNTLVNILGQATGASGESWLAVSVEDLSGYIPAENVNVIGELPTQAPTEAPTPEPTVEPTLEPTEAPSLYTVTYFDYDGNLLIIAEVSSANPLAEESFDGIAAPELLGWSLCDETGAYLSDELFTFGANPEASMSLRARRATPVQQSPERKVTVIAAHDTETLQLGSQITLTAILEGYEGLEYTCRWQYAPADSNGSIIGEWQDGETGEQYTYTLTADNLLTAWRVTVTAAEPAAQQ